MPFPKHNACLRRAGARGGVRVGAVYAPKPSAMNRYPDFIQRILLHEHTLDDPLPKEPTNYELVIRLREADNTLVFGDRTLLDGAPSALVRGGLFYYHNALEDSHKQTQTLEGDTAAYWHGMVHRREGDFDNARYWMRRAGEQPTFQEMQGRASDAAPNMGRQSNWDPFLFITLCEQYKYGETEYKKEIAQLQRVEFAVMFDYVWRQCVSPELPARKG